MSCTNPYVIGKQAFPCGKCLPCRFRQKRIWFHRLLLEGTQHERSSFVTLTYDPAAEPVDGSLSPEHLRNWLKRFRKRCSERYDWLKVRYWAVAEYGDKFGRPHYHIALFGVACDEGNRRDCQCVTCCDVRETWGLGFVTVDRLEPACMAYVCGYVTRKLLTRPMWLGRVPPFTRMSTRPGIGATAMWDVASSVLLFNRMGQGLPRFLLHGPRQMALGRYLRLKLSIMTGLPLDKSEESKLSTVRDFAAANSRSVASVFRELGEVYESQLEQKLSLQKGQL